MTDQTQYPVAHVTGTPAWWPKSIDCRILASAQNYALLIAAPETLALDNEARSALMQTMCDQILPRFRDLVETYAKSVACEEYPLMPLSDERVKVDYDLCMLWGTDGSLIPVGTANSEADIPDGNYFFVRTGGANLKEFLPALGRHKPTRQ